MGMYPTERGMPAPAHVEAHGPSPYARGFITNTKLTEEPAQMVAIEEPTIKKKRKRADAAQLKVLNETYARTAFPSTEERAELAKKLDMSARSVQIWLVYTPLPVTVSIFIYLSVKVSKQASVNETDYAPVVDISADFPSIV
jgi:hypothetical protein